MHRIRIRAAQRIITWAGLFAILALAATPAQAQEQAPRHDPEEHLAKLQEELGLDDQQAEQIRAIFAEQHAAFERLREEEGGDRESRRDAFRQLHEETHARVQAVLNEQQRTRLEELRAEHRERHGDRGHGRSGHEGHPPKDRPDNG
ncbi:MAG: Spy/CpxP family protein refolding chaperone [Gemmatimonadota bacterium]